MPQFVAKPDGVLVSVNAAWREQIGTAPGERWDDLLIDGDRPRAGEAFGRCIGAGEPFQLALTLHHEVARLHYEFVVQRVEGDDGGHRAFGWLYDLRRHDDVRAQALALLETAVDGIIIIDDQGRIEVLNPAASRLFGVSEAEILGQPLTRLMPEPYRSRHDDFVERYLNTGERHIIGIGRELTALHSDGREFPIYLAVSEIPGERRRFTGIIRDLSEQVANRRVLEEQRERLTHVGRLSTMGEMTASIAHEINQPLTAITMYAQAGVKLLGRLTPGSAADSEVVGKLEGALDKLANQSLRAGAIIERIQRFARPQSTTHQTVTVNALIRDLLQLAGSDARLHDIELDLDLDEDLPPVEADAIQLQQVLLNLIRNAIDAMSEIHCQQGNRIRIRSARTAPGWLRVSVSDRGPGVSARDRDRLFTPFHTTKSEGMGMGLSICRSIISAHNGELSFFNNTPDPGATFYFSLPLTAEAGP